MLTTLIIKDFQAHKRLKIDLDPHVTTIIGPSDRGKSAVIRALRWLATNQPTGDAFIREGSGGASIKLLIDGRSIGRAKTRSKNLYLLNGVELKSFKNDVPPEIAGLLNVSEVNFQAQHDSPFWFSNTAGEVSRELNKIINLGQIDSVLKYLNQQARESDNTIRVWEESLAAAKERRSALKPFEAISEQLEALESLDRDVVATTASATELKRLLTTAQRTTRTVKVWAKVAAAGEAAIGHGRAWTQVLARRADLAGLVTAAERYRVASKTKVPDLGPLESLQRRVTATQAEHETLVSLLRKSRALLVTLVTAKNCIKQLEAQKAEIKTCPTCGQIMS